MRRTQGRRRQRSDDDASRVRTHCTACCERDNSAHQTLTPLCFALCCSEPAQVESSLARLSLSDADETVAAGGGLTPKKRAEAEIEFNELTKAQKDAAIKLITDTMPSKGETTKLNASEKQYLTDAVYKFANHNLHNQIVDITFAWKGHKRGTTTEESFTRRKIADIAGEIRRSVNRINKMKAKKKDELTPLEETLLANVEKYGQMNIPNTSAEEAAANKVARDKRSHGRRGAAKLTFNRAHIRGCATAGCVFQSVLQTSPCPCGRSPAHTRRDFSKMTANSIFIRFFEYDHRDPASKEHVVSQMTEGTPKTRALKIKEYMKTDVLCVLHHMAHTTGTERTLADAIAKRPPEERAAVQAYMSVRLDTGCQHPAHKGMPYAAMIDAEVKKRSLLGVKMLERSCMQRGTAAEPMKTSGEWASADLHLTELGFDQAGKRDPKIVPSAWVHCKFCHIAFTVCEGASCFPDSPYIQVRQYKSCVARCCG